MLRAALDGAVKAGAGEAPVHHVLVRPEHVSLDGEGIALRVASCTFEGERFALTLSLPDGQTLKAYVERAVTPGETAHFVINRGWRL